MEPPIAILRHPLDETGLQEALGALARSDADVARALARIGWPKSRRRDPGFATLLRIVVAQQLSTKAAAAIWTRLEQACGGTVTPQAIASSSDDALRSAGFSAAKVRHARELAARLLDGRLDLAALAEAEDAAVMTAITELPGFGPWSAEIYLLFALDRIDVMPAGDLALQVGYQRLKRLESRPDAKALRELTATWSPWRGAGAVFLWHYYGAATLDDASPVPEATTEAARGGAAQPPPAAPTTGIRRPRR